MRTGTVVHTGVTKEPGLAWHGTERACSPTLLPCLLQSTLSIGNRVLGPRRRRVEASQSLGCAGDFRAEVGGRVVNNGGLRGLHSLLRRVSAAVSRSTGEREDDDTAECTETSTTFSL